MVEFFSLISFLSLLFVACFVCWQHSGSEKEEKTHSALKSILKILVQIIFTCVLSDKCDVMED